ncbi:MAG: hypothetical protein A2138_26525 [Deltaproteobacteria bacterium RBG_16_71_12]|nr:MAG: hypothetical protein A2138_26525 [Deltaproteobacteria bacterium RBG_16_71_12]
MPLSLTELRALAVRFDEEAEHIAETFVVQLSPGKLEIVDQLLGAAPALVVAVDGTLMVLDGRDVVHVGGRKHKLAAPRTMAPYAGGALLAADDRLWVFPPDGGSPTRGPRRAVRVLSCAGATVAAVSDHGDLLYGPVTDLRPVTVEAGLRITALALDADLQMVAVAGAKLLAGDARGLRVVAQAPFEINAVARYRDRTLFSSRAFGLFQLDDDGRAAPLKPSLRAHTLTVNAGVLLAASDLYLGVTDDLIDWLTRDLAALTRAAEQRFARFLRPEDTAGG